MKVLLVPAEETYKLTVINIRDAKYVFETRSQLVRLITDFTSWTIYCSKRIKPIIIYDREFRNVEKELIENIKETRMISLRKEIYIF